MRWLTAVALAVGVLVFAVSFGGRDSLLSPERAEASPQTTTVYWGSWTVAGSSALSGFFFDMAKPCSDCYITGAVPDLEYDAGGGNWVSANYTSGAMLHHFVIFNGARTDTTCPTTFGGLGDRFFASGNERTVLSLPGGYGYYIPPAATGTEWDINLHIHNMNPAARSFRIKTVFTWQPASDNLRDVTAVWLDENNCNTSIYPVPAGYSDAHWDWTSTLEGRVLVTAGHVHDYGISASAEKVETGEWICASTAGYASGSTFDPAAVSSPPRPDDAGHPADALTYNPGDSSYAGHIEEMTGCAPDAAIAVGDTLRLHSQYNATAPIDDVMGIMILMVYDNCPLASNPNQADFDADAIGDACDPDIDGDGMANGSDPEADGDRFPNVTETSCGSDPNDSLEVPERVDGAFGGLSDDGDAQVDEGLPGAAIDEDCDGDGYPGSTEAHVFSDTNVRDQDPCGTDAWPADFVSGGIFGSTNKVLIDDLNTFLSPRKLDLNLSGPADPNVRWDLSPGPGIFATDINISDLNALLGGPTAFPPMLYGARALGGPECPWPP